MKKTNQIDSYNSSRSKNTRATLVLANIFILANLLLLPTALYVGNVVHKSINAQNTLLFDGSKAGSWKGQQNTKDTCGSYAKDVSSSPPGKSGTSVEIFLKDGCTWVNNGQDTGTERVELATNGQLEFKEGTVWYIDWYQRFDQLAQPHSTDWDHWLQFHYPGGGSQPNVVMSTVSTTNKMQLKTSIGCGTTRQWLGPDIQTNKWYRFTLGVKTSANAQNGWIELHMDNVNVLPRKNVITLDPNPKQCSPTSNIFIGDRGYLKKGIYRQPALVGDERYTMHGLKVYSTNPLSNTGGSTTPPTGADDTTPTSGDSSTIPTDTSSGSTGNGSTGSTGGTGSTPSTSTGQETTQSLTSQNQNIPTNSSQNNIKIPDNATVKDGIIVADFDGDQVEDVALDSNGDLLINPENEVIINGNTNPEIINRAKNNQLTEADKSLLNATSTNPQKDFKVKIGPLPELTINKLFTYSLILGSGIGLFTVASYWAVIKVPMFSGLRIRLGL